MARNTFLTIFILAFGSMALLGFLSYFKGEGGRAMGDCPFADGSSSMCPMTLLSHIEAWQNLFTITTRLGLAFILISLLAARLVLFKLPILRSPPDQVSLVSVQVSFLPDFLRSAFARGILHPRLYA